MPSYEVRMNREYRLVVEADDAEAAAKQAEAVDPKGWVQAWSLIGVEEADET